MTSRLLMLCVVAAGCREPAERDDDLASRAESESETETGPPPRRDALGLRAALALTRTREFGHWRYETQPKLLGSTPPPAPPPDVVRAIDALLAWDQPTATFSVGCDDTPSPEDRAAFPAVLDIARAALVTVPAPTDARMRAVLHLASALRAPGNGQLAIDAGLGLAVEAAHWLEQHDAAPSTAFTMYAPEPELFERYLQTGQRCAREIAREWLDAADKRGELPSTAEIRAGARDLRAKELHDLDVYCSAAIKAQRAAADADELKRLSAELDHARPSSPRLSLASAQCRGDFAGDVLTDLHTYAAIVDQRKTRRARANRSSSPTRP